MNFINAQRLAQGVRCRRLFSQASSPHVNGECSKRLRHSLCSLKEEAVRIGLQADVAVLVADLKFVVRTFTTPGIKISQTPEGPSERIW